MDNHVTVRISRRGIKIALIMAIVMAVLAPVAAVAAGGTFTDDDTSIFEADIEWMAANGITSGCGGTNYCPEDNVTRGQMAAFMKRLATRKVVEAATAVTAEDATMVGGLTPEQLMAGQPIGVGYVPNPPPGSIQGTGVTGFSSPEDGVYCVVIDPALGVTAGDILVQVAVEWGASSGSDLFAYWQGNSTTFSCTENEFEVRTYQFSYDGDGDVNNVELNASVAWTYSMYVRPPAVGPARVIDQSTPHNTSN